MTVQEKTISLYLVVAVAVFAVYAIIVGRQLGDTPVDAIAYQMALVIAVGCSIVINIVGSIIVSIASPHGHDRPDERARSIVRQGELVGYYVLSAGILGVLALALVSAEQFWIANAIYLAFTIAAVISSVVKLVAFRRGI